MATALNALAVVVGVLAATGTSGAGPHDSSPDPAPGEVVAASAEQPEQVEEVRRLFSASLPGAGTASPAPGGRPTPDPSSRAAPAGSEAAGAGGQPPGPGGPAPRRTVWDALADCESGRWDAGGDPIPGTARWDYGLSYSHGDLFQGGLNFHPGTWDAYRDPAMPSHAGRASRPQEIIVAQRVLAQQGWGAWPACSRKLGLR